MAEITFNCTYDSEDDFDFTSSQLDKWEIETSLASMKESTINEIESIVVSILDTNPRKASQEMKSNRMDITEALEQPREASLMLPVPSLICSEASINNNDLMLSQQPATNSIANSTSVSVAISQATSAGQCPADFKATSNNVQASEACASQTEMSNCNVSLAASKGGALNETHVSAYENFLPLLSSSRQDLTEAPEPHQETSVAFPQNALNYSGEPVNNNHLQLSLRPVVQVSPVSTSNSFSIPRSSKKIATGVRGVKKTKAKSKKVKATKTAWIGSNKKKQLTDRQGNIVAPDTREYTEAFVRNTAHTEETLNKYRLEWRRFKLWLEKKFDTEKRDAFLGGIMDRQDMAVILANYFHVRINIKVFRETGEEEPLDTNTYENIWYSLAHCIRDDLDIDISKEEPFNLTKKTKNAVMKEAKKNNKKGLLSHQPLPWSNAQLAYIMDSHVVSTFSPEALVNNLFFSIMFNFCIRVRAEMRNLTRGDFVRIKDADTNTTGVVYVPQGTTKMDRGNRMAHDAYGYFKRPVAIKLPPHLWKYDFDTILTEVEKHLDMLPFEGDRSEQKLFMAPVKGRPKPGECFFNDFPMGINRFDEIVKSAAANAGLQLDRLQNCNQAIRTTMMAIHEEAGLSDTSTAGIVGHASMKTQKIYKRRNYVTSGRANAILISRITGRNVVHNQENRVRLTNGRVEQVNLKIWDDIPIAGMDLEEFYAGLEH